MAFLMVNQTIAGQIPLKIITLPSLQVSPENSLLKIP